MTPFSSKNWPFWPFIYTTTEFFENFRNLKTGVKVQGFENNTIVCSMQNTKRQIYENVDFMRMHITYVVLLYKVTSAITGLA